MDKYKLKVQSATNPDLIQWQNLGTPQFVRIVVNLVNFLFGICILALMTYVIVVFSEYQNALDSTTTIQDRTVTIEQAYQETLLPNAKGYLNKFCSQDPDSSKLRFPDGKFHCSDLLFQQKV